VKNSIVETSKAMNAILKKDREMMKITSKKLAFKYDWKNVAEAFKKIVEEIVK
jgi:glycosyltransferase involved in cell wall biosynthesis